MGIYLGYGLQLFGRGNDTLSHILVSEDFESHPDFFYKPKVPYKYKTRNGKIINTKDAKIRLAEIDYIHLRSKLLDIFGTEEIGYKEMIGRANGLLDPCARISKLLIDISKRRLTIVLNGNKKYVFLTPQQMALYAYYAKSAKEGKGFQRDICDEMVQNLYQKCRPKAESLKSDFFKPDSINQTRSKIKSCIAKVLGDKVLASCLMASRGERGEKEHGIAINKDKIEIIK